MWLKWLKVAKGGERWRKVGKSRKKSWEKVGKSGLKWEQVEKNGGKW